MRNSHKLHLYEVVSERTKAGCRGQDSVDSCSFRASGPTYREAFDKESVIDCNDLIFIIPYVATPTVVGAIQFVCPSRSIGTLWSNRLRYNASVSGLLEVLNSIFRFMWSRFIDHTHCTQNFGLCKV